MNFISLAFLLFFAVVIGMLALTRLIQENGQTARHFIVLAASYLFYAWWDWRFCGLLFLMTFNAFLAGILMESRARKAAIAMGVVVPLAILAGFKYLNFFLETFRQTFQIDGLSSLNIVLPLGISFYAFQSISYVIDVYRGKVKPESLIHVALFISFFPVITSGPIIKSYVFMPQLKEERQVTLRGLEAGIQIIIFGLFKKIVLVDRLAVFVNDVYATPAAFSSLTVIMAVLAYSLQIYFDFSGYSDMAVGCANCMGYDIPCNFNLPYISKNPSEFWKRWHISLSSWFQEYLYFPLGGSRKGNVRTYINLMVVMMISGLWHGAGWTFIVWGILHGVGSCVHKAWGRYAKGKRRIPASVAATMNFVFVTLCWVFFRADSFEMALQVLSKVFIWSGGVHQIYTWFLFAAAIEIMYLLWCQYRVKYRSSDKSGRNLEAFYLHHDLNSVWGLTVFFLEIIMIIGLAYTGASPFIYAQF